MRELLPALVLLSGCTAQVTLSPTWEPDPLAEGFADLDACGFEDGDLAAFGHPGESWYEAPEGGRVVIVDEGTDFSALSGEEDLEFDGERAVMLRSNDAGDVDTSAVIRTVPFRPGEATFVMDQLSEVDGEYLALSVAIIDAGTGETFEYLDIDVTTGGFIPELLPEHQVIPDAPHITYDGGRSGVFVRTWIDVSDHWLARREIQLEFRQHTRLQDNGFFTLLDNLCLQSIVE